MKDELLRSDYKPRRNRKVMKCYSVPIIGGALKGKMIDIPSVNTTRSSKSILRESLFNTLQYDIIGADFVEVFAGSGSIAIEAISRGASHAWCIERNREVFDILKGNIERLAEDKITPILGDSFDEFPKVASMVSAESDRVYYYFDPPFSIREGMDDIYDKTISLIEGIEPSNCEAVIVEHMTAIDMPDKIGDYELHKKKKFGKSSLSYYKN